MFVLGCVVLTYRAYIIVILKYFSRSLGMILLRFGVLVF